jgi:NCS1 family nucleobase:cation symporter-1
VKKQTIDVPALFSDRPGNTYWYKGGVNPLAVMAVVPATLFAIALNFLPGEWATFSLFIGGILAAVIYTLLSKRQAAA